jgi:hypothetical protein
MLERLEKYFQETSKEKIQADWEAAGKTTEGVYSPTVEKYLEYTRIRGEEIKRFIEQENGLSKK